MYHKNSTEFLESCDTFYLPKYSEYKKNSQSFKIQIVNPILKRVALKFSVQKQQFYAQFENFSKPGIILVSRQLGKNSRTNCVEKSFD